jgi:DNA methylase
VGRDDETATTSGDGCRVYTRWCSLGPYYAMFPVSFARKVIASYTREGDAVLDPFAGRGTSVFCALESGRHALGVEINPLGWIYGQTKIGPAALHKVLDRIDEVGHASKRFERQAELLPEFFQVCYSCRVRSFLVAARSLLRWRTHSVDRTLMAFLLVYLHGKVEADGPTALSNQMRQTKAMAPDYSVRWWKTNGFALPPKLDPTAFLKQRIVWRYADGAPGWDAEVLRLGDCRCVLPRHRRTRANTFKLLFTSPPYRGVTSYYYDQWLRFWLLGDTEHPSRKGVRWKSKFDSRVAYEGLLERAFASSLRLLTPDAVVYVRTDARPQTFESTRAILKRLFPGKAMKCTPAPYVRATQTSLFGDHNQKPGEIDIILRPR